MMRFLWGILMMAVGIGIISYSGDLVQMFGRSQRADENIGGTRQMIILFWFLLIVVAVLIMLGVISGSPDEIHSPLGETVS